MGFSTFVCFLYGDAKKKKKKKKKKKERKHCHPATATATAMSQKYHHSNRLDLLYPTVCNSLPTNHCRTHTSALNT
jgi:hypothetical protein